MIEINLLPKELRRGGRPFLEIDKTLSYMLGAAGIVVVIMVLVTAYQNILKKNLDQSIQKSQAEITRLQEEIKEVDRLN